MKREEETALEGELRVKRLKVLVALCDDKASHEDVAAAAQALDVAGRMSGAYAASVRSSSST